MPEKIRVRIFIDFWNFQIGWNDLHSDKEKITQIPWKDTLPNVLTAEAAKGQPVKFAGAHVYASVDLARPKDRKLSAWLHHGLASFTGYTIEVKERKPRGAIRCPTKTAEP